MADDHSSFEEANTCTDKITEIKLAMEDNAGRANESLLKAMKNKAENSGRNVVLYNEVEK